MKLPNLLVFSSIMLLVLSSVSFINLVSAETECSITINLPNNPVTLIVNNGISSYFQMNLTGFHSENDITNGSYLGWCAQRTTKISRGVSHGVWVCSSYDLTSSFSSFEYVSWDKINYIINHKDYFDNDPIIIQQLIWNLTDNISYSDPIINGYLQDININGSGYCPSDGDIIAILVKSGDNIINPQRTFFETNVPDQNEDEPSEDDDEGGVVYGNHPPTADATAGEPYQGFVGESILFDGSLSYDVDGWIRAYYWQFGDGQTGTGRTYSQVFNDEGIYSVLLTVEDNDGATNGYSTSVEILSANQPPRSPTLTGQRDIEIDTITPFTVVAIDEDNDTIRYIIDWGDGTNTTTTDFYENNTPVTVYHSWSSSNLYLVKVFAEDDLGSPSDTTQQFVFVNVTVIFIDDDIEGYLIDFGKDGLFDSFHNNGTGMDTDVEKNSDGWYLIDSNNDGEWNYQYRADIGLLPYQIEQQKFNYTYIILILAAIIIIIIIAFLYKKRNILIK